MKILTITDANETDLADAAGGDPDLSEVRDSLAARLDEFYLYGAPVRLYTESEGVVILDDDPALSILLDAATVGLDGADEVSTGHSRAALDAAWELLKALRTAVSA